MPRHLDPAAGGERDGQRAVRLFGDHLVGVECELACCGRRTRCKAPDDRSVLRVRVVGAEGLGGIVVEVEVRVAGEGLAGNLGAGDAIRPEAPEGPSVANVVSISVEY